MSNKQPIIMKCKVCHKEIVTHLERIATTHKNKHIKVQTISISDEGVYFEEGNCWFCNKCWKEMS